MKQNDEPHPFLLFCFHPIAICIFLAHTLAPFIFSGWFFYTFLEQCTISFPAPENVGTHLSPLIQERIEPFYFFHLRPDIRKNLDSIIAVMGNRIECGELAGS